MSEWQPIKTAPKDGDSILVYCQKEQMVGLAQWYRRIIRGEYKWAWYWTHAEPDEDSEEWWDCYPTCFPSHWMPLPAPPEDA
jgi:hypothetical protein